MLGRARTLELRVLTLPTFTATLIVRKRTQKIQTTDSKILRRMKILQTTGEEEKMKMIRKKTKKRDLF